MSGHELHACNKRVIDRLLVKLARKHHLLKKIVIGGAILGIGYVALRHFGVIPGGRVTKAFQGYASPYGYSSMPYGYGGYPSAMPSYGYGYPSMPSYGYGYPSMPSYGYGYPQQPYGYGGYPTSPYGYPTMGYPQQSPYGYPSMGYPSMGYGYPQQMPYGYI
jgi:hypothetical protein